MLDQLMAGTAGEDAVVVGRIALRFHQALPAAGRAADKIRIARGLAIERLGERLADDGHLMDAEVREVVDLLPIEPAIGVSAKLPLPPSWPPSVAAAGKALATGPRRVSALPVKKPPPPLPRKRPFQFFTGSATQTFTRSLAGGCVTIAVTRTAPSRAIDGHRFDRRCSE